jgi:hypothetical protein
MAAFGNHFVHKYAAFFAFALMGAYLRAFVFAALNLFAA